jgi:hypothetical protein
VLSDLKRFQREREEDLKRYIVSLACFGAHVMRAKQVQMAYAKCHIEWAKKNLETWEEARGEVDKVDVR